MKRVNFECKICKKIIKLPPAEAARRKTCSYKCKGKYDNVPWNKGVSGYSTSWKGRHHSLKAKRKMVKNSIWNNNKIENIKKYFDNKHSIPSEYEMKFANWLKKNVISFEQQKVIGYKYQVDFLIDEKLIIEVDGAWHYKNGNLRQYDQERDLFLKTLGYEIIHITHKEVDNIGTN